MAVSILTRFFQSDTPARFPEKGKCSYTAYYCEENIWMMVKKIQESCPEMLPSCYAVFISNKNTSIPLWRQSASKQEDGFVIWDYHVIMVYSNEEDCLVFDFDSQLPFPSLFHEYCKETFKSDDILNPQYHRLFRIISAEKYLKYFASDRRHMKNEDGTWKKSPPCHPAIRNKEEAHNLPQYISMKSDKNVNSIYGNIVSLKHFIDKFSYRKSQCADYMFPPDPLQPSWLE